MRFVGFMPLAWRKFFGQLIRGTFFPEFRDDDHRRDVLKAAYWAGAESYRAARYTIETAPVGRDEKERMLQDLDEGLNELGATLKAKTRRRLH